MGDVQSPHKSFDQQEKEIICNTVEEMIDKINKKRRAPDLVFVQQKFKKPTTYFESKGAKKA